MNVARTGSHADATMAAMMDGALAQRLRDEELAREIGKALARSRPTLDDLPDFARRSRRTAGPVDARVDEPWGDFEKKRATSEDQRVALFETAAITPYPPTPRPAVVAPRAQRRAVRWPWIVATTIAAGVAVQLAVPEWWPAVGQRAMQGVDDLRNALKARQSHDAPTLPVAVSAIAAPPPDLEAQAPEFVPLPIPAVVTTTPRLVPPSTAPPPPPPVVTPHRRSPAAAKPRAQAQPITRSPETFDAATEAHAEAAEDAPIPTPSTTNEQTAMADPTPTPTPLEDPPSESPAIREPPPPDSPPGEVPEIREPPPADMPTPIPTEGPTAQ